MWNVQTESSKIHESLYTDDSWSRRHLLFFFLHFISVCACLGVCGGQLGDSWRKSVVHLFTFTWLVGLNPGRQLCRDLYRAIILLPEQSQQPCWLLSSQSVLAVCFCAPCGWQVDGQGVPAVFLAKEPSFRVLGRGCSRSLTPSGRQEQASLAYMHSIRQQACKNAEDIGAHSPCSSNCSLMPSS